MNHYLKVNGGDTVLVDLGEYGLKIYLDEDRRWYDAEYVGIEYDDLGNVYPFNIQADIDITKDAKDARVEQADCVRIWRHGEK